MNVVLIGSGNVATHLGKALKNAGYNVSLVYGRTEKSAKNLAEILSTDYTTDINKIVKHHDLYILAVKDSAIHEVCSFLQLNDKLIIHTSGSTDMDVLKNASSKYGVLWPLQTFSKAKEINFNKIPIFIEGCNKEVVIKLKKMAEQISNKIYETDSEERKIIHLAAVFACNFTNHIYSIAEKILKKNNFSFNILETLIQETAVKALQNSPAKVQTGPAIRKDIETIKNHLDLLQKYDVSFRKIYKEITKGIQTLDNPDK